MNVTRNGKIDRLPPACRHELNGRIERGDSSEGVLAWLNSQAAEPGVLPLGEADLADWRETGYRDWVVQAEALEQAAQLHAEVAELRQAGEEPLTDTLALFLTGQYVRAAKAAVRQAGGSPVPLPVLRVLCGDLVALRRGDHQAERLRLERERLEFDREEGQANFEHRCSEWVQDPANEAKLRPTTLTPEEQRQLLREILQ